MKARTRSLVDDVKMNGRTMHLRHSAPGSVGANELVESHYAATHSLSLCTSIRFFWLLLLGTLFGCPAPVPERRHPLLAPEDSRHVLG
jgi:hypothetical protein